jgi:hypothetical protein
MEPEARECRKCGAVKPLDGFYTNPKCRGGRGHICIACRAAWEANYRREHATEARDRNAAWRAANPERASEHQRRYRKKHAQELAQKGRIRRTEERDRIAARTIMNHAVRDGALRRGACERCGSADHVEGHHADYGRPLDVTWLCAKCHKIVHRTQETEVAA